MGRVPPAPYTAVNISLASSYAFLHDIQSLVKFARLLNLSQWEQQYSSLYSQLAAEFHSAFYSPGSHCYALCEQTANALALALPGVIPAELRQGVVSSLVSDVQSKGHMTCGIIGISQLFTVLSAEGYHDVALQLATSTGYLSYGWQWHNAYDNATTLWELWDSCRQGPQMNSKNHVMFSSIGSWLWRQLAGLHLNGLQRVTVRPRMHYPAALLPTVAVQLHTLKGRLAVRLHRPSDLFTQLEVELPPNLPGEVWLEPGLRGARPLVLRLGGQVLWNAEAGRVLGQNGTAGVLDVRAPCAEDEEDVAARFGGQSLLVSLQSGRFVFNVEWQLPATEEPLEKGAGRLSAG